MLFLHLMWLAVFAGVKAGEVAASSFINWAEAEGCGPQQTLEPQVISHKIVNGSGSNKMQHKAGVNAVNVYKAVPVLQHWRRCG
ncbi:hypothetical protein ABBQ38_005539 [Trebouxia sp. C0009 RCD-2024]